jgi:hypothetical protein
MARMRALLCAAVACAALAAAAAEQLVPDDALLDKVSFLPGPALPAVSSVLDLDGSELPVPWARGADPLYGFVRARGVQLVTGEGAAATPYYHVGAAACARDIRSAPVQLRRGAGARRRQRLLGPLLHPVGPDATYWTQHARARVLAHSARAASVFGAQARISGTGCTWAPPAGRAATARGC